MNSPKSFLSRCLLLITSMVCALIVLVSFMPGQKKITIYSAGDSTMANKDTARNEPGRGWMQMFPGLVNENVEVRNLASPGQSSRSFILRGVWQKLINQVQPGDYVFIQFGHNDPKPDTIRHTDAQTTFRANIMRFVNETREKGANPVLFTSIVRRIFEPDGTLRDTHGAYVTVIREIAAEMKVPLVDLTVKTEKEILAMGPEESKKWFMWIEPGVTPKLPEGFKDNTHLNIYGATRVAELAAKGIRELKIPLAEYLK